MVDKQLKRFFQPNRDLLYDGEDGGGWKLRRLLGEGGFGKVYTVGYVDGARRYTDSDFVLKVEDAYLDGMRRELQATLLLWADKREANNKNIALPQEEQGKVVKSDRLLRQSLASMANASRATRHALIYYVTPMYSSDLLNFVRESGLLNEHDFKMVLLQLILALEYISSKGMSHRDIKSENIFVATNGKVVLADFGLWTRVVNGSQALTKISSMALIDGRLTGTLTFCSLDAHLGASMTYRSDLQNLFFAALEWHYDGNQFGSNEMAAFHGNKSVRVPATLRRHKTTPAVGVYMDKLYLLNNISLHTYLYRSYRIFGASIQKLRVSQRPNYVKLWKKVSRG